MSDVFFAATLSVTTVFVAAAVGAYARRRDILNADGARTIEKLVQEIFTPALVFHKVLPNVSFETLALVWPNAVMCLVTVSFGLLSGWAVCRLLRLHPSQHGIVKVAIAFPNAFATPLTLALTLADQPILRGGAGPASSAEVADHATNLFLFSYVIWLIIRWTIGFSMLTGGCSSPKSLLTKVLNPPVVACLASIVLGLLRHAMGVCEGEGGDACTLLEPFATAADYCGRCLVPCTLLTLGTAVAEAWNNRGARPPALRAARGLPLSKRDSYAAGSRAAAVAGRQSESQVQAFGIEPAAEDGAQDGADAAEPTAGLPTAALVAVVLLRQVAGPAIGVAVACAMHSWCGVTDPVVLLVLLLQTAGPPMINLAVMAGLAGGANCSRDCASVLLVAYSASIVTWTISISSFLWLLRSLE